MATSAVILKFELTNIKLELLIPNIATGAVFKFFLT